MLGSATDITLLMHTDQAFNLNSLKKESNDSCG